AARGHSCAAPHGQAARPASLPPALLAVAVLAVAVPVVGVAVVAVAVVAGRPDRLIRDPVPDRQGPPLAGPVRRPLGPRTRSLAHRTGRGFRSAGGPARSIRGGVLPAAGT